MYAASRSRGWALAVRVWAAIAVADTGAVTVAGSHLPLLPPLRSCPLLRYPRGLPSSSMVEEPGTQGALSPHTDDSTSYAHARAR